MAPVIGIDLGPPTPSSRWSKTGQASAIPDEHGNVLIASGGLVSPESNVPWGAPPKRAAWSINHTIYAVKRLIGAVGTRKSAPRAFALPVPDEKGGASGARVARARPTTLPEISAFVLRKAKSLAEAGAGHDHRSRVITVPANFNDLQRAATKSGRSRPGPSDAHL